MSSFCGLSDRISKFSSISFFSSSPSIRSLRGVSGPVYGGLRLISEVGVRMILLLDCSWICGLVFNAVMN